ncbi:hypothetical protein ACFSX9_02760 [Flavobacterium ardleyense]|uniref:Uncharacterized protein n=1 Tax=Flavobacterium ardleyense TaxID=2038737 RepID=A0ABW5Z4T0_9FLAO
MNSGTCLHETKAEERNLTAQVLNGAKQFKTMKNLFLSLAFMLIGSFSFANTNVENVKLNEVIFDKIEVQAQADGSVEVTLSCGISGTLSWEGNPSTSDIVDVVAYLDDLLC